MLKIVRRDALRFPALPHYGAPLEDGEAELSPESIFPKLELGNEVFL
jgi:hypothetical protein